MRANRTYGSEGGESQALPDPYHVLLTSSKEKTWMAGTSPAMTRRNYKINLLKSAFLAKSPMWPRT
jgi:hypothetical protein